MNLANEAAASADPQDALSLKIMMGFRLDALEGKIDDTNDCIEGPRLCFWEERLHNTLAAGKDSDPEVVALALHRALHRLTKT